MSTRRLLLLSNSRDPEGRYLHGCRDALVEHLAAVRRLLFVPYAGVGGPDAWDGYAATVGEAFARLGVTVGSVHAAPDPVAAVQEAEAIAVGGGNTFHLLATLQRLGLLAPIQARVAAGMPYVGWSAGSVVACPTIGTTNDMPIVHPPDGFDALGLVRFQINAHFTDAHPPGFQGETRRQRLAEYLAANAGARVVGLPEGDWLHVRDAAITLGGPHPAPLFVTGAEARMLAPGASVEQALEG